MNGPYIDPVSKDYTLVNGQILNKDILLSMFYFRFSCPFGTYIFNKQVGCKIQNQIGAKNVTNRKTLENYLYQSASDMISNGYITSLSVICTYYDLRTASFDVTAIAANQQIIKFTWNLEL